MGCSTQKTACRKSAIKSIVKPLKAKGLIMGFAQKIKGGIIMSDYRKFINELKFEGIPFKTFINDDGDMVVRLNEYDDDYTEIIYDGVGNCIRCIDVFEGEVYIQEPKPSDEQAYKNEFINYFAELQLLGNLL